MWIMTDMVSSSFTHCESTVSRCAGHNGKPKTVVENVKKDIKG